MMKKISLPYLTGGVLLLVAGAFFFSFRTSHAPAGIPTAPSSTVTVLYRNATYGFDFTLPADWAGYSVSTGTWTGNAINDQLGEVPFATGTVVSIHNPKWTAEKPYQDIPIMVFTLAQWKYLQDDKFHIGAAPIGPSELGRNSSHVFALPARYNYAYPLGYEEVDVILRGNPLRPYDP